MQKRRGTKLTRKSYGTRNVNTERLWAGSLRTMQMAESECVSESVNLVETEIKWDFKGSGKIESIVEIE